MTAATDQRPAIQPGAYRHYKGNDYRVIGVARHSETGDWLVVYQKQYDDFGLCVRPYDMFVDTVTIDGRPVSRFQLTTPATDPDCPPPNTAPGSGMAPTSPYLDEKTSTVDV